MIETEKTRSGLLTPYLLNHPIVRIVRSYRVKARELNRMELNNKILIVKHSVTLPTATPVPPNKLQEIPVKLH